MRGLYPFLSCLSVLVISQVRSSSVQVGAGTKLYYSDLIESGRALGQVLGPKKKEKLTEVFFMDLFTAPLVGNVCLLIRQGSLMGGPQCRMSILRNSSPTITYFHKFHVDIQMV